MMNNKMKVILYSLTLLVVSSLGYLYFPNLQNENSDLKSSVDYVTIAILAKDKAHTLPIYLEQIEKQTWPASKSYLYIRTNNNNDNTYKILKEWIEKVDHKYAGVYFDESDVNEAVQNYKPHEWSQERLKILSKIRQDSIDFAKKHHSHYFVADCDNFIEKNTIEKLLETGLSIVAPFLRTSNSNFYSNFHAAIDQNGYFAPSSLDHDILTRKLKGLIEVPVVHSSYLVRYDLLDKMNYNDQSGRYDYVIFSDNARKQQIPQYLDNRQLYGRITFAENKEELENEPWLNVFREPLPLSKDESFVFVILTHVRDQKDYQMLKKSYESVRKYYPNEKLVIIDDNSSVALSQKDFPEVTIVQSEFPGSGELLPYYYFLKYKWADKMVFLHDSMFLNRPFLEKEVKVPIKFHFDFETHYWDDSCRINNLLALLKSSKELIELNSFFKDEWNGCFGTASLISLSLLEKLELKYAFTNSLVGKLKSREDRMALERIFGILCIHEDYLSISDCSNFGSIVKFPFCSQENCDVDLVTQLTDSAIIKIWKGR